MKSKMKDIHKVVKKIAHKNATTLKVASNEKYQCDKCEKSFTRSNNLKRHIRVTHLLVQDESFEKESIVDVSSDDKASSINKDLLLLVKYLLFDDIKTPRKLNIK